MVSRLTHLRLPEDVERRIESLVRRGWYKTKSEALIDATRRYLELREPESRVKDIIIKYREGKIKKKTSWDEIRKLCEPAAKKIARKYKTVEELMDEVRRRKLP